MLNIARDRENSTEFDDRYFVYDESGVVLYTGTYAQCLVVVGACLLDPEVTIEEINEKTNKYLFGPSR